MMEKGIQEFATFLYDLRNNFVHNARVFGLPFNPRNANHVGFTTKPSFSDFMEYEFSYLKKPKFEGIVVLMLNPDDIVRILERNFKALLNSYVLARMPKDKLHF